MEELGRADPAILADGSTYPDGPATAASRDRAPLRGSEPTLAAATAALVAARWNGGKGQRPHGLAGAAIPEPREPPARYDPYAPARGSAPVSPAGVHANGNGRGLAAEAPPVPAPATMPFPPVNRPTPYTAPPFNPTPYPGTPPHSPATPQSPAAPYSPSAPYSPGSPPYSPATPYSGSASVAPPAPPYSPAAPYSPATPYGSDEVPVSPAVDAWRPVGSGLETLEPPRDHDRHEQALRIDRDLLEAARLDPVRDLPQRVPSEPDVPDVLLAPNDPLADPGSAPLANRTELSRIATYLRYDDADETGERREGFDVASILTAVRDVPDVADAHLRWSPNGVHVLRLELADGADPSEVSRAVVRLLKEQMGLAAEPNAPPYADEGLERTGGGTEPSRLHRPYVTDHSRSARPVSSFPTDAPPRPRRPSSPSQPNRVIIDHVQVTTLGLEATVDVRLAVAEGGFATGSESGPAVDAYLLRLAATAAVNAVDQLLVDPRTGQERGRCFIEHAAVVPFGNCEVATVVLLLVCAGVPEQLAGAAIVSGDPRHAIVRAALAALNRRLESLLA